MLENQSCSRVVSYKFLRRATSLIVFLLPIVVYLLSNNHEPLTSISMSYWTDSGDIFVGSIVAVAFFLFAYNGNGICKKDQEYWISKCAGFFALLVALIPTDPKGSKIHDIPHWVATITFNHSGLVHITSAVLLFVCLFLLVSIFARRAKYKGSKRRFMIYSLISFCMLFGMPLLFLIGRKLDWSDAVYWVELLGLILFGAGWMIAGGYKSGRKSLNIDLIELGEFDVSANSKCFSTGIVVKPDTKYFIKAEGCWKDSFLSCGATGWGPDWGWWTNRFRLKGYPKLMLCGVIGDKVNYPNYTFSIGDGPFWKTPVQLDELEKEERILYLFSNDKENGYKNNSGFLKVKVFEVNLD